MTILSTVLLCSMETWMIGIASSVIGAILGIFLLFLLVRPRIKIIDKIAIDEDNKLMFCFKNRSICPCINVQASVKVVKKHGNDDETEYKIDLEDSYSPFMSGRWSKEKDAEVGVVTEKTKEELPTNLRLIVTAQHAVSGIISVTTKDFVSNDAQKGTFEKGLFIPARSDYARVYTREHLKAKRIVGWVTTVLVALLTLLYGIYQAENWVHVAICFVILTCFSSLMILLWSSHVQSRVNAFSSRGISHSINLLMIALEQQRPNLQRNTEDIEADKDE